MTFRMAISWLLVTAGVLGATCDARASCGNTTLERDVRNAEIIFAGTVRGITVLPGTTRYVFEGLMYAKGTGTADTLVLSQLGGSQLLTSSTVTFQVGSRYVVLAGRAPDGHFGAIACGAGHPFQVWKDSAASIADRGGRLFLAFDSLNIVALYSKDWSTELGPRNLGPPQPPRKRPLAEIMTDLDSLGSFTGEPRPYSESRTRLPGEVRSAYLFSHQDTGDRVTEDEMLRVLAAIDQRVSRDPPTRR